MGPTSLEARFREVLAFRGSLAEPEAVRAATDLARLMMRVTVGSSEEIDRRREPLRAVLRARTSLSESEVDLLVRLAEAPEFRGVVDVREVDAFVARFGAAAGMLLREHEQAETDLRRYAHTYGCGAAVRLLDAVMAVMVADGSLDTPELWRIVSAATELGVDDVLVAALLRRHDPRYRAGELHAPLQGARVRIGRSPGADVVLFDPQVAVRHCDLVRNGADWRVVDAESGRPTVLNGRPVSSAPFHGQDELRIGPYTLRLDPSGDALHAAWEREFTALSARGLTRRIGDVTLLDDVSFTVFSGEVVAMVGPSGAGKTTLLNAIAGITPADEGDVVFDGEDFHALLAEDRSRVGVVPQDDIVLPELTVEESLYYSGRLRMSADTPPEAVRAEVDRVLGELGIEHIRRSRIGDAVRRGISGGQRKRVNLGQEMLARSMRVLFLDEPTSGLDPRAAQDIVRLVRQLADRGRIVFLVTHDLSPQVMAQVDHLLVLAPGGRVAFFGPPADACAYFSVATPDAIFNRFAEKTPEEWGEAYRASEAARKFVRTREELLRMVASGSAPPLGAQAPALGSFVPGADTIPPMPSALRRAAPPTPAAAPATVRRSRVHELKTLVERYWKVKRRDRTGLWVLAAQPPFLALVMAVVFPEPTMQMMFMLALSCLWFGMSGAVRELIADRVVWGRERRVGVAVAPYVGSKLVVLGFLAILQCSFLSTLNWITHDLGAYGFDPLGLAAVSSLTGIAGMTLGLLVSATFSSTEAAVGALPLLLIPQITFSSLLVGIRDMTSFARVFTWIDPQRYAFDAVLKVGDKLEKATRIPGKWEEVSIAGPLYELGLKGAAADDVGLSMPALCGAMVGFATLFATGAFARVWRRQV